MKKFLIIFTLFTLIFFPQTAFAHVLETDGSIGAVLHIDPNDDPQVGEQSNFFFAIKDKENNFAFEKCQCKVAVSENGKVIEEQTISEPTFSFVFPRQNIYTINLIGTPTMQGDFQPFTLTYDLRLETNANVSQTNYSFSWYLLIPMIFLFLIIAYLFMKTKKKGGVHEKNSKHNSR